MHVAKWSRQNESFDFGKKLHRQILSRYEDFTFGHYKVGDGVITVAGILMATPTDEGLDEEPCLYYGLSMCSPNDNFSKKFGRNNAIDNLIAEKTSNMRGVFGSDESNDPYPESFMEEPPAVVLKLALESHLSKAQRLPNWIPRDYEVEFRGTPRVASIVKYGEEDINPFSKLDQTTLVGGTG